MKLLHTFILCFSLSIFASPPVRSEQETSDDANLRHPQKRDNPCNILMGNLDREAGLCNSIKDNTGQQLCISELFSKAEKVPAECGTIIEGFRSRTLKLIKDRPTVVPTALPKKVVPLPAKDLTPTSAFKCKELISGAVIMSQKCLKKENKIERETCMELFNERLNRLPESCKEGNDVIRSEIIKMERQLYPGTEPTLK